MVDTELKYMCPLSVLFLGRIFGILNEAPGQRNLSVQGCNTSKWFPKHIKQLVIKLKAKFKYCVTNRSK